MSYNRVRIKDWGVGNKGGGGVQGVLKVRNDCSELRSPCLYNTYLISERVIEAVLIYLHNEKIALHTERINIIRQDRAEE